MASFRDQLSRFLLILLFLSPQIHARQASFLTRFMRYGTVSHVDVTEPKQPLSPLPAPAPSPSLAPALTPDPLEITPAPTPAVAADRGDAYGLYGRDSSRFSQTQEKPAAVNDELFNEELVGESYRTGEPKTNLYSTYDDSKGYYTDNNDNNQYKREDSDNSGYPNSYRGHSYPKVYYNNEFYNNRVDSHESYKSDGYRDSEKQGMSDTRFLENGKYYEDVKGENESVNVYDESLGKESVQVGEGYYKYNDNKSPYEFDSMEEYEKQQESQGYVP